MYRRFVGADDERSLAARHRGGAGDDDPVLAAPVVQLQRERRAGLHLDALDLEARTLLQHRVGAPRPRDRPVQAVRTRGRAPSARRRPPCTRCRWSRCATSTASGVSTITRFSTPTVATTRSSAWTYVPRWRSRTRSPCPRLPSASGGVSSETACHEPTSLQSNVPRTTATLARRGRRLHHRVVDRNVGHRGEQRPASISSIGRHRVCGQALRAIGRTAASTRGCMARERREDRGGREAEHARVPDVVARGDVLRAPARAAASRRSAARRTAGAAALPPSASPHSM